jgi:hypothetical protein
MSRRSLPLVSRLAAVVAALLCWMTIWVPISATLPDATITVEERLLYFGFGIAFLATCMVTVLAGLAWLPGASRWWPYAALAVLVVQVVGVIRHAIPSGFFWDGKDEYGTPTGGYEEILPSAGWLMLLMVSVLMLVAALVPLLRRHTAHRERWGLDV